MHIFLGNGSGGFSDGGSLSDGCSSDVALVEATGSGNLDVVTQNYGPNGSRVSVYPGNGDGTFASRVDYAPPDPNTQYRTFTIGDANRDGKPDVIAASQGNPNTSVNPIAAVYLNITTGPFLPLGGPLKPTERYGGGSPCLSCTAQLFTRAAHADPVDTVDGNFTEQYGDLMVPGRGFPLMFARTYNSLAAGTTGPLGFGWSGSYGASLSQDPNSGVVTVTQENGSQATFAKSGSGTPAMYAPTAPRTIATLTQNNDGSWVFTRKTSEALRFSSTGLLTSLTDRNGYATTLAYNGSNQLSTITDPANRSLTLGYTGSLITSVTDPINRVVQYGYNDGLGNLTDVTDVNGGNTHFTYDTGHHLLTVRDQRGNTVTTNHYDGSNRVDYQLDGLSRKTTFTYAPDGSSTITADPMGNQIQETFTAGVRTSLTKGYGTSQAATWSFTYDPSTLGVIGVTDPNGHTTYRTYDASGNPLTVTDGLGRTTSYEYNRFNLPTMVTDPKTVTTTTTYDVGGNILTTSTPLVGSSPLRYRTTTNVYGDSSHPGDVTAITDPDGKQWARSYDTTGDLASTTDPVGDKTTYNYNAVGWLQSTVSPRGNVTGGNPGQFTTTYSYADPLTGTVDEFGDVRVVTDPLSHATTTSYDPDRNVVSLKDGDGNTTGSQYDAANERTDTLRADGTTLHTDYNLDGTVKDQLDGASNMTSYGYDPLARVTSVTDPLLRVTSYSYDGVGNLLTKLDPVTGATCTGTPKVGCTTNGYDAADELTSTTYSDGTTPNVSIGYDADGQRASMTDGTGNSSWTWDSLNRLTASSNGASSTVGYGYDLAGRMTSITYPSSHSVQRVYDDAGRLTSVTDWNSHTTTFTPDPDSNTTAQAYPNQTTATMSYDNADRMTSVSDAPTATPGSPFAGFSYGRDGNGQLSSVSTVGVPPDTHSYGYTTLNQLKTVDSTNYGYSPADTVARLPDSSTLSYDASDQLTSTQSAISVVGTSSAGDTGTSSSLTVNLPAGIVANDEIFVATTQASGGTVSTPAGYSLVSSVTSSGSPAANSILYRLKAAGGESQVTLTYGGAFAKSVVAIVYRGAATSSPVDDKSTGTAAASTAVTAPSVTTTGSYDQLALFTGAVGNSSPASWSAPSGMTSEVQKADQATTSAAALDQTVAASGGTGARTGTLATTGQLAAIMIALKPVRTTYGFDTRGNRTSVTGPAGVTLASMSYDQANRLTAYGASTTFKYDGRGLRMTKTSGSTVHAFAWNDSGTVPQLLVDATSSTVRTSYIYGIGSTPIEEVSSSGAIHYFHQDQLGSTRVVTDSTGAVSDTFTYDAYGNLSSSTGTVPAPFRFSGQYLDNESGLYYLRTRYYDTSTAQFLSRDPLTSTTGEPYGYVLDNPLNSVDPSGLCGWNPFGSDSCIGAAAGAVAGAVGAAGQWTWDHRGAIATGLAAAACVAAAPETLGGSIAVCGAATGVATGVRVEQRIQDKGFRASLSENLVDVAVTGVTFGVLGVPASIGEASAEEFAGPGAVWFLKAHNALPDLVDLFTELLNPKGASAAGLETSCS